VKIKDEYWIMATIPFLCFIMFIWCVIVPERIEIDTGENYKELLEGLNNISNRAIEARNITNCLCICNNSSSPEAQNPSFVLLMKEDK